MSPKLRVDRHFLFLHNEKLAIFIERVLRATTNNPNLRRPDEIYTALQNNYTEFRRIIHTPYRKRGEKKMKLRELEFFLMADLNHFADYIEQNVMCRSDIFTTGFHSQMGSRKPAPKPRRHLKNAKSVEIGNHAEDERI